jgi:hypothetical protein
MDKAKYEWLKDIKNRIAQGKPTTFAERNILNMENKKAAKKQPKQPKKNKWNRYN